MKNVLKVSLEEAMQTWLSKEKESSFRPQGLACENLAEMMAEAAAAVYDASYAGSVAGAEDPELCW